MPPSLIDPGNICTLQYIITHVFCPLRLPGGDDHCVPHDYSLAGAVSSTLHLYLDHVDQANTPQWHSISRMLDNLQTVIEFDRLDRAQTVSQLSTMNTGDVLAFFIRAQNAAILFRKREDVTVFESFEASPKAKDVMAAEGKLIRSYPGPAIEIPNATFENDNFLSELSNFLVRMNDDILDAAPVSKKAQSAMLEFRDTPHPRYVTELLTGIFRSVGRPADVVRITKRIGDDVSWNSSKLPWRRSPLWLLIRVGIQTTLNQSPLGHGTYKRFILFFMCCLADEKLCVDLPNDVLQFMLAKISRRLRKLGSSAPDWLSRIVLATCTSLRSTLDKRWRQVQVVQQAYPARALSQLHLSQDIELSLLSSGPYICSRLANNVAKPPSAPLIPKHHLRGSLDDFLSADGAFFEEAYRSEPNVTLYDVERTVERGIDEWVDRVADGNDACVRLEMLGNKYSSSALKIYEGNPELLSVMLLTTIELWVALDKIAIREIPMLADYSPEVPTRLLEELLLCKAASLSRLRQIHQYLSLRHSQSCRHTQLQSQGSVFSPTISTGTFAVRYYNQSSHLQHLKCQIENAAQLDVDKKVTRLEKANARHAKLAQEVIGLQHASDLTRDDRGSRVFHPKKCRKCRLERKLTGMEIAVHEWPLPAKDLEAEVVVFELDCPVAFNMWRAATLHLLVDICSQPPEPKDPYIRLDKYEALRPFLVKHPRSRISLASNTKPFVITHYRKVPIPAVQKQVCVNNGLTFYGFDKHARVPTSEALGQIDIKWHCTYELESGPYQNLQKYVDTTSHTSNAIMANQAECHKDLSIHEYMAFGHLRSGGPLQWFNILRNLRDRALSFRHQEVRSLIAQAASQVGPLVNGELVWHQELQEPAFCHALIAELEGLLRDVKANWLEGVTVDTISFLLRRILTSNFDQAISQKILELLRAMRRRVFSWVLELSSKLWEAPGDEELRGLLLDTAAICRSTFDIDPAMIREVLRSAEEVEVLLFSAMLIHDNTPGKVSSLPAYSRLLLDRDRHFSIALESILRELIQAHAECEGINLAVCRVWPLYYPGSQWKSSCHPNSPWFSCETAPTANCYSQAVSFNLLNGSLLVDGRPLGRLPRTIVQHPLYSLIFGKQILEVTPADLPGMDYSTRDMISGHRVYFALREDDLVIQAEREAANYSATIELIPQERLVEDLPRVLIEGYAHWLNISSSVLEIRPLNELWKSSAEHWQIDCTSDRYRARKGRGFLIDIKSPTWAAISSLLTPLDSPQNLIITASPIDSDQSRAPLGLFVDLPRYGLSFYVDEDGDLRSRNIRGMVYDENQSTGTMFGLVNQLVLRPKSRDDRPDGLVPRCVLIPEGNISFQIDNHHVCVEINTGGLTLQRIPYQIYRVDTDLGCLSGNVSLTSKLYCAYLHALTSGCGIDPLTGRSGTEEALSLLRSGGCWSIMKLGPREAELLGLIASICPSRTWYPEYLKCMQKVEWLSLPTNTQNHELYSVAKGIKEQCEQVLLFHDKHSDDSLFQAFPLRDEHLLRRSTLRAAYLFPREFSGQPLEAIVDVKYLGRDFLVSTSGEHRAYAAAATVYHRSTDGVTTQCVKKMSDGWKNLKKTVSGRAPLSLQYDRSWLEPDFSSTWLEAFRLLRSNDDGKWIKLLFSLPAMAYASPKSSELVSALVAVATDPRFCSEDPPSYDSYILADGFSPSPSTLQKYISNCARPFSESPESNEPAKSGESLKALRNRQLKMYNDRRDSDANATVYQLLNAWPCETPPHCLLDPDLYDVTDFTAKAQSHFSSCYRNLELDEHLTRVLAILNRMHHQVVSTPRVGYSFQHSQSIPPRVSWLPAVDLLFTRPAPTLPSNPRSPSYTPASLALLNTSSSGHAPLHQLISTVDTDAVNHFQRQYVSVLRESAESFFDKETSSVTNSGVTRPTAKRLMEYYGKCRTLYIRSLAYVQLHFGPRNQSEQALEQSGQWPRFTTSALLRLLASNSSFALPNDWKRCLTRLASLLLALQRARRILQLHLDNKCEELYKELGNEGCDTWDEERPDWLLIQLQCNFLIRPVQADVADKMISPRSGRNTAMQLNMGEGKSSVIVPISAAALADGHKIVRVIVPKALTAQMFQLLVDRLGGLANRQIYFIPFSRSINISPKHVSVLLDIMLECMRNRGILVVQPEHVLSLKLVTVEKQLSDVAKCQIDQVPVLLLELQKWLHSRCRDILDESDEILHVRYQLVYTIGLQRHLEGFPERWSTTQQILSLVHKCASPLRKQFPLGLEYEPGPSGSFSHFRILRAETGKELVSRVVQAVMKGELRAFNFRQVSPGLRSAIQSFISRQNVAPATIRLVKEHFRNTPLWGGLLLLRGLLATGILLFAFMERRWRVDYGLALSRTMLAVPYRAKDVPAQRAEFGHPDVSIILTCLSYYYGGLDEQQLRVCFEILLKQDDPSLDYSFWVRECPSVPDELLSFSGINIKSSDQWQNHLLRLFSRNKSTIDFYLSRVVFPRGAKEFPSKLSCSGWDLAEEKECLVTGFSGTNDGRYLLPLHITQQDPEHQRGTNAKVLAYLLQPENNYYMCTTHSSGERRGERRTTSEFLGILVDQKPEIRVLLDVGAQMLDLENHELAKAWLQVSVNSSAAIYFNEDDELTVLTRDGETQLLLSSPFAQQLDQCIIYLDDAHTRGTDINFPTGFRAAVMLGPKVTKDRLTQACMRMRMLGHGHSVMFFAPLEVDRRIHYVVGKNPSSSISSADILRWAIQETCDDIQQRVPHWAQQGMDHATRHAAWASFCRNELSPNQLSDEWLQPEAKRLEDLYGPRDPSDTTLLLARHPDIRQHCIRLGVPWVHAISVDEEQEREIVHEAERERLVERPSKMEPAVHSIHPDVIAFVKTGIFPRDTKALRPAFETLDATSAAFREAYVWSSSVLTTMDFEKTVQSSSKKDDYLRPVMWVVSRKRGKDEVLVIVSPHEAEHLLPDIRSELSNEVHLHLYSPRVTKSTKSCDDLALYSIPPISAGWTASPRLVDQLSMFAGQLYLKDHETYIRVCRFLCVYAKDLGYKEGGRVGSDGFIAPKDRPRHLQQARRAFLESPVDSLKTLVSLRRKGLSFAPTHVGKLLDGELLSKDDFDDRNDKKD